MPVNLVLITVPKGRGKFTAADLILPAYIYQYSTARDREDDFLSG